MNSRDYWAKREAEALNHRITDEAEYDREIEKIYQNMLDACQKEIDSFYAKYASAEGITIAEAKKRVSQHDVKAFERKAAKYVKDKDFSKKANEELRLYNATMKINRLEMLKANIGLETIAGHDELEKYMAGILKGRTEDELKRQAGILGKTVRNNAAKADAIVNGSFHSGTFSDRIWQYQDLMRQDLGRLLQQGLIQGKGARAIAKDLRQYWYGKDPKTGGGATYCMERLMRTELARVQTEAQKQSFIRNGFDMYEFICNVHPTKHGTCDICRALDGKHFKVEDMMPGENAPPMHPHCRCSTAAWEDDEEYEAWLDYLEQGGTTEEWEKQKAVAEGNQVGKRAAKKTGTSPAKEKQDAEVYARSKGVEYVDYSKLPLETAIALNRAIDTLPDDVRPLFVGDSSTLEKYWGGKLPRSSKNFFGVNIQAFNGVHVDGRMNYDKHGYLVGISSHYKALDKIAEAKAAYQVKYQERHNGRKWYYNVSGETTPFHEMGHVYASIKGLPRGFEFAANKWATDEKCDMLSNPEEAWAEAWAAYHTGSNELPDYIRKYMEDASKK